MKGNPEQLLSVVHAIDVMTPSLAEQICKKVLEYLPTLGVHYFVVRSSSEPLSEEHDRIGETEGGGLLTASDAWTLDTFDTSPHETILGKGGGPLTQVGWVAVNKQNLWVTPSEREHTMVDADSYVNQWSGESTVVADLPKYRQGRQDRNTKTSVIIHRKGSGAPWASHVANFEFAEREEMRTSLRDELESLAEIAFQTIVKSGWSEQHRADTRSALQEIEEIGDPHAAADSMNRLIRSIDVLDGSVEAVARDQLERLLKRFDVDLMAYWRATEVLDASHDAPEVKLEPIARWRFGWDERSNPDLLSLDDQSDQYRQVSFAYNRQSTLLIALSDSEEGSFPRAVTSCWISRDRRPLTEFTVEQLKELPRHATDVRRLNQTPPAQVSVICFLRTPVTAGIYETGVINFESHSDIPADDAETSMRSFRRIAEAVARLNYLSAECDANRNGSSAAISGIDLEMSDLLRRSLEVFVGYSERCEQNVKRLIDKAIYEINSLNNQRVQQVDYKPLSSGSALDELTKKLESANMIIGYVAERDSESDEVALAGNVRDELMYAIGRLGPGRVVPVREKTQGEELGFILSSLNLLDVPRSDGDGKVLEDDFRHELRQKIGSVLQLEWEL